MEVEQVPGEAPDLGFPPEMSPEIGHVVSIGELHSTINLTYCLSASASLRSQPTIVMIVGLGKSL